MYFATLLPRAIAKFKLKEKMRPLPPQLNRARHASRAEHDLFFISRFGFVSDCRRVASKRLYDVVRFGLAGMAAG
jgi:hypothetical protein